MDLEHILCQIQANYANLIHDASPHLVVVGTPLWHIAMPSWVGGVHFIKLRGWNTFLSLALPTILVNIANKLLHICKFRYSWFHADSCNAIARLPL